MRYLWPIAFGVALACCSSKDKPSKKDNERAGPSAPAQPAHEAEDATTVPHEARLPPAPPIPPPPLGLPDAPRVDHNPLTPDKVALGQLLFFDDRLSRDRSMACASCHQPERGWASGKPRCKTVEGTPNLRHTPSLANVAYEKELFWDGRMAPLEAAIEAHWKGQLDADPPQIAARLAQVPRYRAHFARTFHGAPDGERVVEALASFVRTIRSGDAPFDRYEVSGDASTVSPAAIAGAKVFAQKAQCAVCHPPPLYTDFSYYAPPAPPAGASAGASQPVDIGRALVTENVHDKGAFKTPTLRGVVHTAPYFHDGSAKTIEEAVARCLGRGGQSGSDNEVTAVHLTREEVDQVIAFLQALTPARVPYARPELPPDPPAASPAP